MNGLTSRAIVGVAALALAACSKDVAESEALSGLSSITATDPGGISADDGGSAGESTAGAATDGPSEPSASGSEDAASEKFDVGAPAGEGPGCGGRAGEAFSWIWIANTSEGTVSKIDTQTGVETGRYFTHPDQGAGSPSRTSVNLLGDVAVSNRSPGGVLEIAAHRDRCVDNDGNGTIETSTGATPLPWAEEECRLWYHEIPTVALQAGPRPTAWEGGSNPQDPCAAEPPRLWVGYKDEVTHNGVFLRLDGATGETLDEVIGPDWGSGYGPYGGAVNGEGDLWATGLGSSHAVHIDAETLELTDVGPAPGGSFYGMAVAADGDLWAAGGGTVNHWDVATESWKVLDLGDVVARGIQIDQSGIAWIAINEPCALATVDTHTDTIVDNAIALPECVVPVGISIDRDQFVWIVDRNANRAFKLDPVTRDVALSVTGLVSPYTYSDMTGSGLQLVVDPPG